MSSDVEEIKHRLNLVDLVGSYLPLRKSGAGWKGTCPFHQEKTPSFHVNLDRQIFKCFGCNEAGDALDFVMKMEHLTFPEALQMLADRVGVILDKRKTPAQYAQEKDAKSRLYQINRLSVEVFARVLNSLPGQSAREYLRRRGLTEMTINTFRLGFAPPSGGPGVPTVLEEFLTKRGFSAAERRLAGSPERFRNRLMFPLWDTLGNVVGFTGRALSDADQPKYLNTTETPIFKKSRLLYPLHVARDAIKTTEHVILVEGQMDVLLAHQLGTAEVVATSGTALTIDHLEILARYTPRIRLAFDNDAAGIEATRKAILLVYDLELEPSVITLPNEFKDLGDLALAQPDMWPARVAAAQPAFAWQLALAVAGVSDSREASSKKAIARLVLPLLSRIRDPIERTHWQQVLAQTIHVSERTIIEALERTKQKTEDRRSRFDNRGSTIERSGQETEKALTGSAERTSPAEILIGLLVAFPVHVSHVVPRLDLADFPADTRAHRLAKALSVWYSTSDTTAKSNVFEALKPHLDRADIVWLSGLLIDLEGRHADSSAATIRAEIESGLARLQATRRDALKGAMAEKIAAAEAAGDRAGVKKLLEDFQLMLKAK